MCLKVCMYEVKGSSAREMMHCGLLPTDCDVLVAGDDHGRVWIYDVNRCLCESRQGKKLEELKETQVCVYPAGGWAESSFFFQ